MYLAPHHKFFLLTYLWSWPVWGMLALTSTPLEGVVPMALFAVAGIGPSLMGILFARRTQSPHYWASFVDRIRNPSRISPSGYGAIFLIVPASTVVALGAYALISGSLPDFETASSYARNPLALLSFAAFTMLFGPIPEEMGWRGFAQDSLERTRSWVGASVFIGVGWSIWHIPLLGIPDTYQNGLVGGSPWPIVDFFAQFIILAVITGWIRWSQNGSILSAILFHFATNYVGEVLDLPTGAMYLRTLVQLCIAVMLVRMYRNHAAGDSGAPAGDSAPL